MFFKKLLLTIGILFGTLMVSGWMTHPKQDVFILGNGMGTSGENYGPLYDALNRAGPGEKIYIILHGNRGGWSYTGESIYRAMKASKAVVVTESRILSSSAAMDVLFGGDYVIIHKNTKVGMAHLSFMGSFYNKIRTPWRMQSDIQRMQYYRPFMTADEWYRMTQGEDVNLYGNSICSLAKVKTVDNANMCVIKTGR